MIDYKKLGRVLDSADQQKIDTLINVNTDPLISQFDEQFIKHGFVEVKDNKYNLKMRDDARSVFQITKSIALDEINFLVGVIGKLLSDKTEEGLKKEIDTLRDRLQIENLENTKISDNHKKLVGDLYREIDEIKRDNQKLSKQVEDLSDRPKKLRAKGLM